MPEISIKYKLHPSFDELSEQSKGLIGKAQKISEDAYAPYSDFHVGAAALLDNGEIVLGSNQENRAYPSGLCAERVALFYVGANFPNAEIVELAIVANGDLISKEDVISPCGSCRQVMMESENRQKTAMKVLLVSQDGKVAEFESAGDLLPYSFGS